jgi:hypothetical protein
VVARWSGGHGPLDTATETAISRIAHERLVTPWFEAGLARHHIKVVR